MVTNMKPPAAGYKVNTFQEIKSHSSILYNERMAILFYMLDMKSIHLNTYYNIDTLAEVRGIIKQIYKNIRTLIRNNPTMRVTLNLETKDNGIYVTDIIIGTIDRMFEWCAYSGYTTRGIYIMVEKLKEIEVIIKDILQYYHYFIRPDFRQKPDIEIATETYKGIADRRTIDELKALVGKNHKIDFDALGTDKVEISNDEQIEYDEELDGPKEEENEDELKEK